MYFWITYYLDSTTPVLTKWALYIFWYILRGLKLMFNSSDYVSYVIEYKLHINNIFSMSRHKHHLCQSISEHQQQQISSVLSSEYLRLKLKFLNLNFWSRLTDVRCHLVKIKTFKTWLGFEFIAWLVFNSLDTLLKDEFKN